MSAEDITIDFSQHHIEAETGKLRFGKYIGETLNDVAVKNPGYLVWLLETISDLTDDERDQVVAAITDVAITYGGAAADALAQKTVAQKLAQKSAAVLAGLLAGKLAGKSEPVAAKSPKLPKPPAVAARNAPAEGTLEDRFAALDLSPAPSVLPPLSQPAAPFRWTDEQERALEALRHWAAGEGPPMISLTGYGGTGKTTVLREAVKFMHLPHLSAMTGRAALRLQEVTGRSGVTTLHSILYGRPDESTSGALAFTVRKKPTMATLVIDECFEYRQMILTETGWQRIGKVVNSQAKILVWSRNPATGQLELKPITRWLKRRYDRDLVEIRAGRSNSLNTARIIRCTPEHKILTLRGYRRAGAIRVGDEIVVRGLALTPVQRSVLVGSMLGDGSMDRGRRRNSPQPVFVQGVDQLSYLQYKRRVFGRLAGKERQYASGYKNGKAVYKFALNITDDSWRLAKEMPFRGKHLSGRRRWSPTDRFLALIDEQALATWFLDNGTLQRIKLVGGRYSVYAGLSSERFSRRDHVRFVRLLRTRFDLVSRIQACRDGMYCLRFNKENTQRLLQIVRPYTPACMAWKTDGLGEYDYTPEVQPETTVAAVQSVRSSKVYKSYVYDIEVADYHNYIAGNIVVSNCSLVTPKIYQDLIEWANVGTKILLVGDGFQLPPILTKEEALTWGDDFTVFEHVKGPMLTKVMRSSGPILDAATYLRENRAIQTRSNGPYQYARLRDPLGQAVSDYLLDSDDHVLATWRNDRRMHANAVIRARLGRYSPTPELGEPILIRQNSGYYLNGEIVTAVDVRPGPTIGGPNGLPHGHTSADKAGLETTWLKVTGGDAILVLLQGRDSFMDGLRPYIDDWRAWRAFGDRQLSERPILDENGKPLPLPIPVTWGYCLTVHALQGSEYRKVTIFLGPGDGASRNFRKPSRLPSGEIVPQSVRWVYTSLSRAKEELSFYVSQS